MRSLENEFKIIGAGAWGLAIAVAASNNVKQVTLLSNDEGLMYSINTSHIHPSFPNIVLPKNISAGLVKKTDGLVCVATNAQNFDQALEHIENNSSILIASKGFHLKQKSFLSDMASKITSDISIISGPNFAEELINKQPTMSNIASNSNTFTNILKTDYFKIVEIDDIIGAQIGGILKNIYAIGAGIIDGLSLGRNIHAAYIYKALNEMKMFINALGGTEKTAYELCGLGDLILSCSSEKSRNMRFGKMIAKGFSPNDIIKDLGTCEGYWNLQELDHLNPQKLNLPIISVINNVLQNNISSDELLKCILK